MVAVLLLALAAQEDDSKIYEALEERQREETEEARQERERRRMERNPRDPGYSGEVEDLTRSREEVEAEAKAERLYAQFTGAVRAYRVCFFGALGATICYGVVWALAFRRNPLIAYPWRTLAIFVLSLLWFLVALMADHLQEVIQKVAFPGEGPDIELGLVVGFVCLALAIVRMVRRRGLEEAAARAG